MLQTYALSYGGGVNSTALLIWLVENRRPLDYVVFADTGNEMPETYAYIEYFKEYLSSHGLALTVVRNRKLESLFDRCFRRRVIPSEVWRWCTRDFKIRPIHRFYKSLRSSIVQYIAIDYDEVGRIKDSGKPWISNEYPLVDNKITREQCVEIIGRAGLQIPIKSGCFFCPFNGKDRREYLRQKHPALFLKLQQLDRNNKYYPAQTLFKSAGELCDSGHCMV